MLRLLLTWLLAWYTSTFGCVHDCDVTQAPILCDEPEITFNMTFPGSIDAICSGAECAWVTQPNADETCGCTWTNMHRLYWNDPRILNCLSTYSTPLSLTFHGWVRWWSDHCVGHTEMLYEIEFLQAQQDVFKHVDDLELEYINGTTVVISTNGDQVVVEKNTTLYSPYIRPTKDHIHINYCWVNILDCPTGNASVIRTIPSSEFPTNDFRIIPVEPEGERAEFTAFIDNVTYSPWQVLRCHWSYFNGTAIEHNADERPMMIKSGENITRSTIIIQ